MQTYTEHQKFRQPWLWILILFSGMMPVAIFGTGVYLQIFKGQQFGNNPMSNNGLITTFILTICFVLALVALFVFSKLTINIDKKSLRFRFVPFLIKEKTIMWTEVNCYRVEKYNPVMEYGGWGLRFNNKGKAYIVSGNMGLRLELHNGKVLLLGTSKSEKLKRFLEQLNPLGERSVIQ